jgi:hypothetical protein
MSVDLRVDWCDHKAAEYAVMHWHYSKRMPMPPLLKVGVWENGKFIGCVLFARGANHVVGKEYGLTQMEACELVRVALTKHDAPVSQIVSVAIRMLQKNSPGLRLIVSYADSEQGHHGGIYQAMNWVYVGRGMSTRYFFHEGRWKHNREVTAGAFGGQRKIIDYKHLPQKIVEGKHKYLYPLDRAMRKQIAPLAKPYPKRETCGQSVEGDTDSHQLSEAGSIPAGRSTQ